jgi:NAD(P)H-hydrate epimerase
MAEHGPLETLTIETAHRLLPDRPEEGHKGTFGHCFVLAGSRGLSGAAGLVARGVLRAGAGLCTIGMPQPLGDLIGFYVLEATTRPLPFTGAETLALEALEPALDFARDKQAVVLGPGLSQHPETQAFIRAFVAQCPAPLVIDADGLNALAQELAPLAKRDAATIITPHPGEMARLCGMETGHVQRRRAEAAERLAAEQHCVVVLKGAATLVTDGYETCKNATGNSGMGTGGTGDVLAGVIGGLLAQGMQPLDAARLGVFVHGLAGDLAAAEKSGRGMMAGDLAEALPAAWRRIEENG